MSLNASSLDDRDIARHAVRVEQRADGTILITNPRPLGEPLVRVTDRLDHWAAQTPNATWLAERDAAGGWRALTYAEGLARVRRIAAALGARTLGPERPVVILSGNGIDHALMAAAAMYAGIPYAPIAPAYATVSSDFAKLRGVLDLLRPGLIFASPPSPFARAIEALVPVGTDVVVSRGSLPGRTTLTLDDLEREVADIAAALAPRRAGRSLDDIAKFLFTSGSTGVPKAVINTHRMLSANVVQISDHFAYFRAEPPVVVDWAPWNHTAGGNHNFNLVLHNGGTLYIDDGKPTPGGIEATVRSLREVSPTWYFNVPKGYSALLPHLAADAALRETFFKRLKLMWYAGAGMARHVWDGLDDLAIRTTGKRVPILTGLGATETAPFALAADRTMVDTGLVGLPATGCTLKLVPSGGKLEARIKGPNVTPGYWRQPDQTAKAFDEDGFYKLGDALRFAVPGDASKGFYFDGRVSEDFKLATGTWVAVGVLRSAFIDHCAPYIQDVVLAGLDRDFVTALVFLDIETCKGLTRQENPTLETLTRDPNVRAMFADRLRRFAAAATGSSTRIERLILIDTLPSIDSAELTDKGSLNQRAVVENRAAAVAALYADPPPADVIVA